MDAALRVSREGQPCTGPSDSLRFRLLHQNEIVPVDEFFIPLVPENRFDIL